MITVVDLSLARPDWLQLSTVVVAAVGLVLVGALALKLRSVSGEHRRDVEELQHSTIHITTLVDAALDAIVAMDQDGLITQWNPRAEELLGWQAEEVIGRRLGDIVVPERWRRDHERGLERLIRTGQGGSMLGRLREVTALRRDGTEVPIDLAISQGIADQGQATFVAFLRDVSGRQRAERLQAVRFVVAGVLGQARSLPEAIHGVLTAVGTRLHAPVTAYWAPTLGGLGSDEQWADRPGDVERLLRATQLTTMAVGNGLAGRVWSTARPMTLDDVPSSHEDFERLRLAAEGGLGWAVAVPVTSGERVLGVIEVFASRRDDIDEETLRTLDDIGGQLGQYLARRRAESLQESPDRLQALLERAADAIVTVADDGAVIGLNERARRLLGYTSLEVMGEDMRVLIAEQDRDQMIGYVSECLDHAYGDGAARRWCELSVQRKDGSEEPAGLHITPVRIAGRQLFMCLIGDPATGEVRGEAAELRVLRGDHSVTRPA